MCSKGEPCRLRMRNRISPAEAEASASTSASDCSPAVDTRAAVGRPSGLAFASHRAWSIDGRVAEEQLRGVDSGDWSIVLTLAYPTRISPRSFYKPVRAVAFCDGAFQNGFEKTKSAKVRSSPIGRIGCSETLVSEKRRSDLQKGLAM